MSIRFNRGIIQPHSSLELLAKQAVEGFITGLHKSPFHGFSVEFAEHRAYNPGESTRHLDWKLLARTDKHFTKRYEEETNLRCQLVVDVSSSMLFPGKVNPNDLNEWNKLKFALYGAASIMELLLKQRDAVGLSLFNDKLLLHSKASSSQAHVRYLYSELEGQLVQSGNSFNAKTHVSEVLHEIAERTHKRSMVVIFSDMLDDQRQVDEIFNALQHLRHNKHEVLLFQVVHENQEVSFNFENRPTTFVDLETGQEIKLHPHEVRKTYMQKMEVFKSELKLKAGQIGVDYFEANMQDGVHHVLLQFLLKRQRMNA
jgi:uncharacterized protein (DUF58 family)